MGPPSRLIYCEKIRLEVRNKAEWSSRRLYVLEPDQFGSNPTSTYLSGIPKEHHGLILLSRALVSLTVHIISSRPSSKRSSANFSSKTAILRAANVNCRSLSAK